MEEELSKKLDERYLGCDFKGHISPDEETNLCGYCFRRLDYNFANAISEQGQRRLDRLTGLSLLRKELFPERKLLSR